jgi:hypothetical protein
MTSRHPEKVSEQVAYRKAEGLETALAGLTVTASEAGAGAEAALTAAAFESIVLG